MSNPLYLSISKVYVANYPNLAAFPTIGAKNTIYIDNSTNNIYQWDGSMYDVLGTNIIAGESDTYADLPAASAHNKEVWLVTTNSGGFDAGFYVSNGTTWTMINLIPTGLSATIPLSYNDTTGIISLNYTANFTLNGGNLDISSSYAGQSSITTLGTITTGIWNGTPISLTSYASGTLQAAQFPALTGDVVTSAGNLATTISSQAVTYAKIQNLSTNNLLLGRYSSGAGSVQEISLGSGVSLSGGGVLSATGLGGTVTTLSVVTANGFAGSVANPTTTPAITLTTTITGILKGNGTAISAAVPGTDYEVPLTFSTGLTRSTNTITVNTSQNISQLSNLTTNGFVKTSSGNGTLSIDTNTYLTGNQTITLSGDISGSGATSIATTIGNNAVTYAKFQQVASNSLVGNSTGSLANASNIGLASNLIFSGGNLATSPTPTFSTLTINNGGSGISGTNFPLIFTSGLGAGNYMNLGTSGRNMGVFQGGRFFLTFNLDYNATTQTYVYNNSSNSAAAIELGNSTAIALKYAPIGTGGANVTPSTGLSISNAGVVNIPNLTASSLVATDGSSNLTSSVSGLSPTFTGLTLSGLTSGSVLFAESGVISQNNSKLFWDNTNFRLGIGINTPSYPLHVRYTGTAGTGAQLASFGTSAAERIEFYDENTSLSLGPRLYFNSGNQAQIASAGILSFYPSNASSPVLALAANTVLIPGLTVSHLVATDSGSNLISTNTLSSTVLGNITKITLTLLSSGSGTYIPPTNCTHIFIEMWGGAGGAGGVAGNVSSAGASGGGGGGGYIQQVITNPSVSGYSYSVGAGGTGGAAGATNGNVGSATTFASLTANGGSPGNGATAGLGAALIAGGAGGTVPAGTYNLFAFGSAGTPGIVYSTTLAQGGSGGGSAGGGGSTINNISSGAGVVGQFPGGGGGGAVSTDGTSYAGGDGASGYIKIFEYYNG